MARSNGRRNSMVFLFTLWSLSLGALAKSNMEERKFKIPSMDLTSAGLGGQGAGMGGLPGQGASAGGFPPQPNPMGPFGPSQQVIIGAPQMGQPQMGLPQMGQPQMSPPQMGPPQMGPPQMGPPQLGQMGPPQMGPPHQLQPYGSYEPYEQGYAGPPGQYAPQQPAYPPFGYKDPGFSVQTGFEGFLVPNSWYGLLPWGVEGIVVVIVGIVVAMVIVVSIAAALIWLTGFGDFALVKEQARQYVPSINLFSGDYLNQLTTTVLNAVERYNQLVKEEKVWEEKALEVLS